MLLVSRVQHSDSVIHTCFFSKFFSHLDYCKILSSILLTVVPRWLFILYMAMCTSQFQTLNLTPIGPSGYFLSL